MFHLTAHGELSFEPKIGDTNIFIIYNINYKTNKNMEVLYMHVISIKA